MKSGVELIAAERAAQVSREGWTPEHDDEHDQGELACAAAAYIEHAVHQNNGTLLGNEPPGFWPWDDEWWKPKGQMRNLIRAGALIAAEIDRLQRAKARQGTSAGGSDA